MTQDTLLVLDLDGTLIHSDDAPLPGVESAQILLGDWVHVRPHARAFLAAARQHFALGVWSASAPEYIEQILEVLEIEVASLHCCYDFDRCTTIYHATELWQVIFVKNLRKVKGFPKERMLILDDTPTTYQKNYSNAIPITRWTGDSSDTELARLMPHLPLLAAAPDVRKINKRIF